MTWRKQERRGGIETELHNAVVVAPGGSRNAVVALKRIFIFILHLLFGGKQERRGGIETASRSPRKPWRPWKQERRGGIETRRRPRMPHRIAPRSRNAVVALKLR